MDNNNNVYTIGVDMGGTNTRFALVDRSGRVSGRGNMATCGFKTAMDFASHLSSKMRELVDGADGKVIGIGIGAPCANPSTGCIEAATDLPWPSPIPLAAMLRDGTSLQVEISNDANAAAMGAMAYGVARGLRNFIMLTLGTGVGGGVVCDSHLLSGSQGFAGELGHVAFPFAADRICSCGRRGCLQTVASAGGVVETARRMLAESDSPSSLRNVMEEGLTAQIIGEHADNGDVLSREVFRFTGKCLGEACASFAAFTDPDAIVLFGGVANSFHLLEESMREALEKNALHLYRNRIRILRSVLPESDAALLGAASLPYQNH